MSVPRGRGFARAVLIAVSLVAVSAAPGCQCADRLDDPLVVSATPPDRLAGLRVVVGAKDVLVELAKPTSITCAQGVGHETPRTPSGEVDGPALKRCFRSLKSSPDDPSAGLVEVSAAPDVAYQDLIVTLDALRSDATGDLFADPTFGVPTGSPPPRPIAQPSAAPTAVGERVPLPARVLPAASDPLDGLLIRVSKSGIVVGDETGPIVEYDLAEIAREGLPARAKRDGRSDYFIAPLGAAVTEFRDRDRRIREAKGVDATSSEAILVVDAKIPYRVFYEVLFTLGATDFIRYHLMVLTGRPEP